MYYIDKITIKLRNLTLNHLITLDDIIRYKIKLYLDYMTYYDMKFKYLSSINYDI